MLDAGDGAGAGEYFIPCRFLGRACGVGQEAADGAPVRV
jgi:hypothetical protein